MGSPHLAEDIASPGRSRARHSPPGRVSTNEKNNEEKEDGVKGWEGWGGRARGLQLRGLGVAVVTTCV